MCLNSPMTTNTNPNTTPSVCKGGPDAHARMGLQHHDAATAERHADKPAFQAASTEAAEAHRTACLRHTPETCKVAWDASSAANSAAAASRSKNARQSF